MGNRPPGTQWLHRSRSESAQFSILERMMMTHETMRQACSHDLAFHKVITVHAEGSMEAHKMMILAEAPLQRYEEMAQRRAGILPWIGADGIPPS